MKKLLKRIKTETYYFVDGKKIFGVTKCIHGDVDLCEIGAIDNKIDVKELIADD